MGPIANCCTKYEEGGDKKAIDLTNNTNNRNQSVRASGILKSNRNTYQSMQSID